MSSSRFLKLVKQVEDEDIFQLSIKNLVAYRNRKDNKIYIVDENKKIIKLVIKDIYPETPSRLIIELSKEIKNLV